MKILIDGGETLIPRSSRVICRYSNNRLLLHFIINSTRMAEEVAIDIEQCERETNDGERKTILRMWLQMLQRSKEWSLLISIYGGRDHRKF